MARISSARDSAKDRASASDSARDSTNARELEIIEKFLHPYCLPVHKVQFFYHFVMV